MYWLQALSEFGQELCKVIHKAIQALNFFHIRGTRHFQDCFGFLLIDFDSFKTCRKFEASQPKEPLMPVETPSRPREKIGVDLFSFDNKDFLLTVDYFSNYWEIVKLNNTLASTVVLKLKSHLARYGCPDQVFSDNGPQFTSDTFQKFAGTWEFEHLTNNLGNPKANGKAESAIKTVKNLLRKALDSGRDPYMAILDYCHTLTQGLDASPAHRLMNHPHQDTIANSHINYYNLE